MYGFVERLKLRGAEVVATWATDDSLLADAPAITVHQHGAGRVFYVAGYADEKNITVILELIRQQVTLPTLASASNDVEVIRRRSNRNVYTWLLNHGSEPQYVEGLPVGRELLSDSEVDGKLKLKPFGVAIVQSRAKGE